MRTIDEDDLDEDDKHKDDPAPPRLLALAATRFLSAHFHPFHLVLPAPTARPNQADVDGAPLHMPTRLPTCSPSEECGPPLHRCDVEDRFSWRGLSFFCVFVYSPGGSAHGVRRAFSLLYFAVFVIALQARSPRCRPGRCKSREGKRTFRAFPPVLFSPRSASPAASDGETPTKPSATSLGSERIGSVVRRCTASFLSALALRADCHGDPRRQRN
ncbi:hypothetical protein MRX96_042792 [Rhipicephalus microplus]